MFPFEPSRSPRTSGPWKHGPIPVVGLTGGIASGKSEVARLLAERGSAVIDADKVGHELFDDAAVRAQVVERFGPAVGSEDGAPSRARTRIDRKRLAAIVFDDPSARRALEAILHPLMRTRFLSTIQALEQRERETSPWVVLDAAILLEAGWDDLCDRVVFVDAPRDERSSRALVQRGWSQEMFRAREQAQWPCEAKRRRADFVINNSARVDSLGQEVDRMSKMLLLPSSDSTPLDPVGAKLTAQPFPVTGKSVTDSSRRQAEGNLA